MLNASDLIGKAVLSLYESKLEGTVFNIYLNKKKTKASVLEILKSNEEKAYLYYKDIYIINQALVIKTADHLINKDEIDLTENISSPMNKLIYSTSGKVIGQVLDVNLSSKMDINSLIVQKFEISQDYFEDFMEDENNTSTMQNNEVTHFETLSVKNISRWGEVLICQDEEQPIKISSIKPNKIFLDKKSNQQVFILNKDNGINAINNFEQKETDLNIRTKNSNNTTLENATQIINKNNKFDTSISPAAVLSNSYDFLLGRKVDKTIFANNNEVIIKKGTKVLNKHIELASVYGKLRELSIYSKL